MVRYNGNIWTKGDETHYASGEQCLAFTDMTAQCNALRKALVAGTATSDAYCADALCSATQYAQGTECVEYLADCDKATQLVGGTNDTNRYCEGCTSGFYQDLDNSTEQCKAYTVCDQTEIEIVAPSTSNNRECGCAEDHHFGLPAQASITEVSFTANGNVHYVVNEQNDPDIQLCKDQSIVFKRSDGGHALLIVTEAD